MDSTKKSGSSGDPIKEAARAIRSSRYLTAFTGAGISVESGIPPFRGPGGLWGKYDPRTLDIGYFAAEPGLAWPAIKEIFYDFFGKAQPNEAHLVLARMECDGWERDARSGGERVADGPAGRGYLRLLITQNIDDLHYRAGSRKVVEYHGNSRMLACRACAKRYPVEDVDLSVLPPHCSCGSVLKPDFVFFGEAIPGAAVAASDEAVRRCDVMLVVGTTGEVYPAALVPREASKLGSTIIEINPEPSNLTHEISDIFIALPATAALAGIAAELGI